MKLIDKTKETKSFKPVTIEMTFESDMELAIFFARMTTNDTPSLQGSVHRYGKYENAPVKYIESNEVLRTTNLFIEFKDPIAKRAGWIL